MNYVYTETKGRIASVVLDRPDKRNALNAEFVRELKQAISGFQDDPGIRVIILRSSGNVFCAGADLAYLQELQSNSFEENLNDSKNLAELFTQIYSCAKPVISMVNGPALAGGCGIATVCDFCFATPESTFGYTESRIGFIPAIVMVFLRNKIGEALSKKLLFTGEIFSASKALEYTMITEIVGPDQLDEYVMTFAEDLANKSSGHSIRMIKEMYSGLPGMTLSESVDYACRMNALARETDDCRAGIRAFLNKQKPAW